MVQRLQHRVGLELVAVQQPPLQLANPHRDARQFGGVFVQLDAQHVVRAGHQIGLALQAQRGGFDMALVLDVLERLQRPGTESCRCRRPGRARGKSFSWSSQPMNFGLAQPCSFYRLSLVLLASSACSTGTSCSQICSSGRCSTGSTMRAMVAGSV